jgi:septum formation protein
MGLILASSSPRRKKILEELGYNFKCISPDVDESNLDNLNPVDYVKYISNKKAKYVYKSNNKNYVLSGDTIINFNEEIIGKPSSLNEAILILMKLSNKTHTVISGLSLCYQGKNITIYDQTDVTFKKLSEADITNYVNSFGVLDKAGAYNIEDAESILIKHIDGCYNNIVGFPVNKFKMSNIKTVIDNI